MLQQTDLSDAPDVARTLAADGLPCPGRGGGAIVLRWICLLWILWGLLLRRLCWRFGASDVVWSSLMRGGRGCPGWSRRRSNSFDGGETAFGGCLCLRLCTAKSLAEFFDYFSTKPYDAADNEKPDDQGDHTGDRGVGEEGQEVWDGGGEHLGKLPCDHSRLANRAFPLCESAW